MAAINFPDSPSNGDTHVVDGVTYTYNSAETKWKTTINSNAFLPLSGGTVSGNLSVSGDVTVDTNTLYVDSTNNRVGINTTSPLNLLTVQGNGEFRTSSSSAISLHNETEYYGFIGNNSGNLTINAGGTSDTLALQTNGIERARLDSSGNLKFNSGYGSVATAYGCRAWVNFDGTGTVSIRDDGNVTSITDNGTGDYTINFTNSMPDTNYATLLTTSMGASGVYAHVQTPSTGSVRILTKSAHVSGQTAGTVYDTQVYAAIVR